MTVCRCVCVRAFLVSSLTHDTCLSLGLELANMVLVLPDGLWLSSQIPSLPLEPFLPIYSSMYMRVAGQLS